MKLRKVPGNDVLSFTINALFFKYFKIDKHASFSNVRSGVRSLDNGVGTAITIISEFSISLISFVGK